jgi:hypothetical protein
MKKENQIKTTNNVRNELSLNQTPTRLIIPKDNEQQDDAFGCNSTSKFNSLVQLPVAPCHRRQNNARSTQSSVRYAS